LQLKPNDRILAFARLGDFLRQFVAFKNNPEPIGEFPLAWISTFDEAMHKAGILNPWFSIGNQLYCFNAIAGMLEEEKLRKWAESYHLETNTAVKRISVVMAGNIPLVGFHDFLCVLMAGHHFLGKLSSADTVLLPALAEVLLHLEPGFSDKISFIDGRLTGQDAVIATGSNNSFRYFDYYFRDFPRILRKNRNGIAVIDGTESQQELEGLADDIFLYFGMGCRSVTKVFTPKGYDVRRLFAFFVKYEGINQHNKYRNNYDYYKSIYLVNSDPFYEAGLVLFKPDHGLHASPVSVVFYEEYESIDSLKALINEHLDDIQCIVTKADLPGSLVAFGHSQQPGLIDYADGVDVMEFLLNLQ